VTEACSWDRSSLGLATSAPVHIRLVGEQQLADVRVLTDETGVVEHLAMMARDNHQFA
jgi:hypothetical protein